MKLTTCLYADRQHLVVIDANWKDPEHAKALILTLHPTWGNAVATLQQFIEQASVTLPLAQSIVTNSNPTDWIALQQLRLLAPIPQPLRNIICLGWNYAEHAIESSAAKNISIDELPTDPIVFTKATTTVNGPFDTIEYDERVSKRLDWEVELGVIIGKQGRHIAHSQALEHVFGYTVINDISARDLQKRHQQFFLGKSVDGTCPMGPWVVTRDEINNPQNLRLNCKVNGVIKQDANTDQQIFKIKDVINTLSNVMTLMPGDIIATGTPSGVGFARHPPEFLQPNDIVECEVEHIGSIKNIVKAIDS